MSVERSVEIVVAGVVQGVAFRWQASVAAERLGVTGWVRNEPDGSVRCRAEGPAEAVVGFVDWCRRGPRWATVERVEVTDVERVGYGSFEISG
ncbi:MAG TPA: acylphosphatase [Pengzhenrongella sp.]|jgi:acylphosphatase